MLIAQMIRYTSIVNDLISTFKIGVKNVLSFGIFVEASRKASIKIPKCKKGRIQTFA